MKWKRGTSPAIGPEMMPPPPMLADEDVFDRRTLGRLALWGIATIGAVTLAFYVSQQRAGGRHEQISSDELARQAQRIQSVTRDTESEVKRLSLAINTLNSDRDRLYARLSSLEQTMDSVTGSINRSGAARPAAPASASPPPPAAAAAPDTAAIAKPSPPLMPAQSIVAPPDAAAAQLQPAVPPIMAKVDDVATVPVPRTQFGIDLGTAPNVDGLRTAWRRMAAAHPALAGLQPIVAIKERGGIAGIQFRLVAGPLNDAASAAQLCAGLPGPEQKFCEPAVYDGQRLALTGPPAPPKPRRTLPRPAAAAAAPAPAR